jgi:hypothetical protein
MASYKSAVSWIAYNDEPGEPDPEVLAGLVSVCLVADLWQKTPEEVAQAVLKVRTEMPKQEVLNGVVH